MRVYSILQEDLVDGSGVDMYLGGQPMVCLALTAQLVTDYLSYRYLHIAICFHAVLPIPCIIPTTTKKEASKFRLLTAVVEIPLQGKNKMPAY